MEGGIPSDAPSEKAIEYIAEKIYDNLLKRELDALRADLRDKYKSKLSTLEVELRLIR
jgi:hypothetical protein